MKYQEVTRIDREDFTKVFESGEADDVCNALVRLAFHDEDWEWVEDLCLEATRNPDPRIRSVAVTCLGHLARIHRRLHLERVSPVLKELLRDNELSGHVKDALDDIKTFLNIDLSEQW
jgi:hypothetical protein